MFEPLKLGNRVEMVFKSRSGDDDTVEYASQILDFTDEGIMCAMPIYEGHIVPLEKGKRFEGYFYSDNKIYRAMCYVVSRGKEEKVTDYKETDKYYVFSYKGINPQLMNDNVTAVLHAKNKSEEYTSPKKIMSVKEYAYTMLDRYSDEEHSKLRTLLVDLLNYGAAAQIYAGYQTDNLVNSDLTDVQKDWASKDTTEFKNIRNLNYKTISNPSAEWKTCSLVLKNSIMVKVKFSAKDVENKTVEIVLKNAKFTYNKDDFVNNGDGTYYVYCNELFANELSDDLLFTIYENGKPCSNTMLFSVESYARLVRDNYKDKPLDKMTTAMMLYGNSAKAYGA